VADWAGASDRRCDVSARGGRASGLSPATREERTRAAQSMHGPAVGGLHAKRDAGIPPDAIHRAALRSGPAVRAAPARRPDGHPRFLACLVDEMERSGELTTGAAAVRDVMPDALQHLFERRAAALSDPEREVLEVAAMAGPSFSVSAIAAALSRDEEGVELLCEAIAGRHAIVKRSDGHRCLGGQDFGNHSFVHRCVAMPCVEQWPLGVVPACCAVWMQRRTCSGRTARAPPWGSFRRSST
jgi:hypothetical protein